MIDHSEALADPERLRRLAEYDLDSPDLRRRLDDLARRTAHAMGQPIAMVNLVLDTAQLLVGASGIDDSWILAAGGAPVEWSFCATAVVSQQPYVVSDAASDAIQHDNPLVTMDGIEAYAGVPLRSAEGDILGATCVVNLQPSAFSDDELVQLEEASLEASAILEEFRRPA